MMKLSPAFAVLVAVFAQAYASAPSSSLRGPKSQRRLSEAASAAALCSAHPGCSALGLQGECCPSASGQDLGCCNEAAGDNAANAAAPTDTASLEVAPPPAPFQLDNSWWTTPPESAAETACLMEHAFGCNVIAHQLTCLGSKDARVNETIDGLKIKGQPCVWCGGGPCTSGSTSLCEPLDYLMNGEGKAFTTFFAKPTYQVAKCENGQPQPPQRIFRHPAPPVIPTLAPWWVPEPPSPEVLSCLNPLPSGCFGATTMGQCLHSRDAGSVTQMNGLNVAGQACVWCAGGACTSNSSALCAPFDYVLRGEGTAFGLFYAKTFFQVATCPKSPVEVPAGINYKCLEEAPKGCNSLMDAVGCLSHVDGRPNATMNGFKVAGQPCVWCGGGPCTSNNFNKCEPFDWVMNGMGQAFVASYHAKQNYRIAGCKNDRPTSVSLHSYEDVTGGYFFDPLEQAPLVPFWVAKKPLAMDMKCLKPAEGGCNSLRDMASCMTSKDGRQISEFMGLKIQGEACVWCGGVPCTTNSTSLCEPFDYVMYGEGKAFNSFSAKGVYKVADCLKGDIRLPDYDYSCLETSGTGGCTDIWNAEECLASKDGRSVPTVGVLQVQNQPCVWCGGGPCHSGAPSLCEAFDYAVNGEGRAFAQFQAEGNYRLAACQGGKAAAATLTNFTDFVPGYTFKPLPMPTIPPREKWWVPQRPSEANISCLTPQPSGCSAMKDMGGCLSSRDGRAVATTADGLKIQGEPCVWCGGGQCHSNSTATCEPFDYLMNGEGKAFTIFYTPHHFQVANCEAGPVPLPDFNFACLSAENSGCNAFTDAGTCLQSKDGRPDVTIAGLKVHDQPCVWCGGTPCSSGSGALCEPYDYAMNGEGKAFNVFNAKLSYTFAGCKDNKPAAMTYDGFVPYVQGYLHQLDTPQQIVPYWVPEAPTEDDMTCLSQYAGGCEAIGEMKTCLSSRDGSSTAEYKGLKIKGEPCVWCGGGPCTTNSSAKCMSFDYAMHGTGVAFSDFLAKTNFRVAGCYAPYHKPAYDYTCLKAASTGCSAITNPYDCLGSTDGRQNPTIDGLAVAGEPCVWCGGGLCHTGATTMCEPFDYVMNGAGRAFYNFNAKLTYRMAACQDGHPQGANLDGFQSYTPGAVPTIKPYWWITEPKPQGEELSCLMEHHFGCYVIKHKETCLGSRDARDKEDFMGLKIKGEPCVWCGGLPCQSNSTNLCEPYDFLMHGEGKAFMNFNAKTSYNVARCKNGQPTNPNTYEASIGNVADQLSGQTADPGTLAVSGAEAAAGAAAAGAAATAAGVAGSAATQEAAAGAAGEEVDNTGKDCWYECEQKDGFCAWCGTGNACCRDGWQSGAAECQGATGFTTSDNHECVPAAATPQAGLGSGPEETAEVSKGTVVVNEGGSSTVVAPVGVSVPVVPGAPAAPPAAPGSVDTGAVTPPAAPAAPTVAPVDLPTAAPPATMAASTAAPAAVDPDAPSTMGPGSLTLAPVTMSTAAPVALSTAAPADAGTVAPVATLAPLPTLAPVDASTAAPTVTGAPKEVTISTPAPVAASTAAPPTIAPLPTVAPGALPEGEPTAAPPTIAPLPTVAPGTLPEGEPTAAPPTIAPLPTVAPGTLPEGEPTVTDAPPEVIVPPLPPVAPVASTAAPEAASTPAPGTLPEGEPSETTAAPATVQPPNVAEDDCWWKCGEKSGDCPDFCGEGKACCKSAAIGDAPECGGLSLGSFSTIFHHVCVETASSTTAETTGAPTVPGFGVRTSLPAGPGNHDILPGDNVADRNATNGTNTTMIAGAVTEGGIPSWVWILLAVALLVFIPLIAYIFCCQGKEKRSVRKSKKSKRAAREVDVNEDSGELEMQTPLVSTQDRSVNISQGGGGGDLFDQIDRNHDGIISQDEFNRAMGYRQQAQVAAPVATTAMPYQTAVPYQVAAPVMTMAPQQSMLVPAAEPLSVMQGAMTMGAAPAPMRQPGMPGAVTVSPYGANIQYGQPGMRPYGQ